MGTEAKSLDGMVVSTDRIFDKLKGLRRTWWDRLGVSRPSKNLKNS